MPLTPALAAAALAGRPLPPPGAGLVPLSWLAAAEDWPTDDAAVLLARVALAADGTGPDDHSGTGQWLVALPRDTGALVVGHCGVRAWSTDGREAEIGYGLSGSARGQGMATRTVGRLVVHLLDTPGVLAVVARTSRDNPASRRLLVRLGFRQVRGPVHRELTYRRQNTACPSDAP